MCKKYKHGIACMRCQPLHNGHVKLIKRMNEECENVTILLGSSQENRTKKNPFTVIERQILLSKVFSNYKNINWIAIKDINSYKNWGKYVISAVNYKLWNLSAVDSYYGGEENIYNFLGKNIYIEMCNRDDISGTIVRDLMFNKKTDEWKKYVPEEIHFDLSLFKEIVKNEMIEFND